MRELLASSEKEIKNKKYSNLEMWQYDQILATFKDSSALHGGLVLYITKRGKSSQFSW